MNELERRVEKAENMLRRARLQASLPTEADISPDAPQVCTDAPAETEEYDFGSVPQLTTGATLSNQHIPVLPYQPNMNPSDTQQRDSSSQQQRPHTPPTRIEPHDLHHTVVDDRLESPPHVSGDFEWDESEVRSPVATSQLQQDVASSPSNDSEAVGDGMATLAIDDSQSAYFGDASGAALLRVMDLGTSPQPSKRRTAPRTDRHVARELSDVYMQPSSKRLITDNLIDAYFRYYHVSYPIIHEPTFRAQYAEVVERPHGQCWTFLAHIVAAIGAFTTSSDDTADNSLFAEVKSLMHVSYLETGNLTLVRALVLMSNLVQKKDMPNSGYNYLGLATRVAIGIGLHKEFRKSSASLFKMETRRRVWWCMTVFDVGAELTFGRPVLWPAGGFDVALPLNVHDWQLTASSAKDPEESQEITLYSALRVYATLYLAIVPIYARMTSKPYPSAEELITLDDQVLHRWYSSLPAHFAEFAEIPWKHRLSHSVMLWKYWNFRILMYRPFVVRDMLHASQGNGVQSGHSTPSQDRCLQEAKSTITSIKDFWEQQERTRLGAWYALYFLFQAALIPCICLRSVPKSSRAAEWQEQVHITLAVMKLLGEWTQSSKKCCDVLWRLCGEHLHADPSTPDVMAFRGSPSVMPSPGFYTSIWPGVYPIEGLDSDMAMQTDTWADFLQDGS
ncbi:hypothetical protein LTR27_008727 [Elasticomyces elasticus]|nr:hypothetical protein LTR27_008727 [Elasticomyces elasticus]